MKQIKESVKKYFINWLDGYMLNTTNWNRKRDLLRVKKLVYESLADYDESSKKEVLKIAKENIKKMYE